MPITTSCPGCKSLFRLPDALAGKQVRCQKCAQMFMVPALSSAAIEPTIAVSEPSAPAPAPEPEPTPEPAAATPPELPGEDIVEATLAPSQPTVQPPPRPRPPEPSRSVAGIVALLLLFVVVLFGVGTFAILWVTSHLSAPLRVSNVPRLVANNQGKQDFRFNGMNQIGGINFDKKPIDGRAEPVTPELLLLGPDGRAFANQNTEQAPWKNHGKWNNDGPYRLYRVFLKKGTIYNIHIGSNAANVFPRLRIIEGDRDADPIVSDTSSAFPVSVILTAYRPVRTGDHLLWITLSDRAVANFNLNLAPQTIEKAIQADLPKNSRTGFSQQRQLQFNNPLDPAKKLLGPYHEYEVQLEANKEYLFSVNNAAFSPHLRVHNQDRANAPNLGVAMRSVELAFRPPTAGKYHVRVTSQHFGLGTYTLNIAEKVPPVHFILARLDEDGKFTDMRALKSTDPRLPTGLYKAYHLALEQGQKYRIEMSQADTKTSLALFDPKGNEISTTAGSVIFTANQTGTYRVHAIAPLPKNGQPYTLRVTTEP